jgi:hypothetical protein
MHPSLDSTATARIPVLVTPAEKSRIAAAARAAGLSVGALMRRAALAYRPDEDDAALLDAAIARIDASTARANAALSDALARVAASRKRLAKLESRGRRR